MIKTLTALALAATLAACSTTSPDVIARSDATHLSSVLSGTVESVRAVTVEGGQSGVGAAAGAIIGGTAGSSVGGKREQAAVGTLVAVLGGILGNAIERSATREEAQEIVVRLASGERRAVVQAIGSEVLRPGDAVTVVTTAGRARVTRGTTPAPTPI
jgi:outer membrane lipoprotein SlyB